MTLPNLNDALIGTMVGSYRVERLLGEGGMGAVYELLHPGIGKRLALKLLHAEYAARPQIVQRFFDEARAVNLIEHPNIVDILDFAKLPDGRAYLTMEYLAGDSLGDYIRKHGKLSPETVAKITLPLCSALGAAHANGIVHRDLKPENIHLENRMDNPLYVKVLDFGIAKLSADLHSMPGVATRSGVVMGTPTYMSPEQAMGRTKEVDHRTDIYAVGIIMYEMLAGHVPFSAESFGDLMLQHLQQAPPPLRVVRPDVPEPWNGVVQRALAKRREDRFQSMEEMAEAIRGAMAGVAVPAPAPAPTPSGGGTVPYDASMSVPGPPSMPSYAPPAATAQSVASASGVQTSPGSAGHGKAIAFAITGVLALGGALTAFVLTRGGGGSSDVASAAPTIDAGVIAKAMPPDAAPVAKAAVPDAAPPVIATPKKPEKKKRNRPKVKKGEGTLIVRVRPWVDVYVDGRKIGSAPQTLKLPAGKHKVRIVNSELGKSKTITVRLRDGKTHTITRDWRE